MLTLAANAMQMQWEHIRGDLPLFIMGRVNKFTTHNGKKSANTRVLIILLLAAVRERLRFRLRV